MIEPSYSFDSGVGQMKRPRIAGARSVLHALIVLCAVSWLVSSAPAAQFVPTVHGDAPDAAPGDGVCAAADGTCTLRAAIEEANALSGADSVTIPTGTYRLERALGELVVSEDLVITGGGRTLTRIKGNKPYVDGPGSRILHVLAGTVSLQSVGLHNGGLTTGCGGGVLNEAGATLSLANVNVTRNITSGNGQGEGGAGICNYGTLSVYSSLLMGNRADNGAAGGGLFNGGTAQIDATTIQRNRAGDGGGIASTGVLDVQRSTFQRNIGANGGGISATGMTSVTNSTLTQNVAEGEGGGISGGAGTTLIQVSIVGNAGLHGGGVSGPLSIGNSLLARNRSSRPPVLANNCNPAIAVNSLGTNLETSNTCQFGLTDFTNVVAYIGGLRYNGGITKTHALKETPPGVINHAAGRGDPSLCTPTDQRGFPRSSPCDIGSFEIQ